MSTFYVNGIAYHTNGSAPNIGDLASIGPGEATHVVTAISSDGQVPIELANPNIYYLDNGTTYETTEVLQLGDTVQVYGYLNPLYNGQHIVTGIPVPAPAIGSTNTEIGMLVTGTPYLQGLSNVPSETIMMEIFGQRIELCEECQVMFAYNPPPITEANPIRPPKKCLRCFKPSPITQAAPKVDFQYLDPDLLWEEDRSY